MKPPVVMEIEKEIEKLANNLQLERHVTPRVELTVETVNHLVEGAFRLNAAYRTRLGVASYIAVASSTGMRSCSMLRRGRPGRITKRQGARCKHVTFFAVEGGPGCPNDIVAWYKPPYTKTALESGIAYPLHATPTLAMSAPHLLILSACTDGILERPIKDYLDPAYLAGRQTRLIPLRSEL